MKKPFSSLSSQAQLRLGNLIYALVFALMLYKAVTSVTIYETLLFSIPALYCVYALFSQRGRARFYRINEYVYDRCEPAAALKAMEFYPRLCSSKRYAAPLRLLRAYALMDSGQGEEAGRFITQTAKAAFSTPSAQPIGRYLLFTIAFLQRDLPGAEEQFAWLREHRDAFLTGKDGGKPSHIWYQLEGNHCLLTDDYERAGQLYDQVDPAALPTNRDRAYYHYFRALLSAALSDKAEAERLLSAARELGNGIWYIQHWGE